MYEFAMAAITKYNRTAYKTELYCLTVLEAESKSKVPEGFLLSPGGKDGFQAPLLNPEMAV